MSEQNKTDAVEQTATVETTPETYTGTIEAIPDSNPEAPVELLTTGDVSPVKNGKQRRAEKRARKLADKAKLETVETVKLEKVKGKLTSVKKETPTESKKAYREHLRTLDDQKLSLIASHVDDKLKAKALGQTLQGVKAFLDYCLTRNDCERDGIGQRIITLPTLFARFNEITGSHLDATLAVSKSKVATRLVNAVYSLSNNPLSKLFFRLDFLLRDSQKITGNQGAWVLTRGNREKLHVPTPKVTPLISNELKKFCH